MAAPLESGGMTSREEEKKEGEEDQIISAVKRKIQELQTNNTEVGGSRALEASIKRYKGLLQKILTGDAVCAETGRELGVTGVEPGATPLISSEVAGTSMLTPEQYDASFRGGLQEGKGGRLEK